MTPTPCPKCGTMLDANERQGPTFVSPHFPENCLAIVITQRDEARSKMKELTGIALDLAIYADDSYEYREARAALEKLRGQ